jgi:hypothetical protein
LDAVKRLGDANTMRQVMLAAIEPEFKRLMFGPVG